MSGLGVVVAMVSGVVAAAWIVPRYGEPLAFLAAFVIGFIVAEVGS